MLKKAKMCCDNTDSDVSDEAASCLKLIWQQTDCFLSVDLSFVCVFPLHGLKTFSLEFPNCK